MDLLAVVAFVLIVPFGALLLLLFYGHRSSKRNPLRDNAKDFPLGDTDGDGEPDYGVAGVYD